MACGGIELRSMDGEVTGQLLVSLADKLYAERLERFGTKVIGLGHAECRNIIHDADGDSWAQCYAVSCIIVQLIETEIH